MTKKTPIDATATVEGQLVDEMRTNGPVTAGHFDFVTSDDSDDVFVFGCPCGCGEARMLSFRSESTARHDWDGNRERPTVTPEIVIPQHDSERNVVGDHWRGRLVAGVFESC